MVAHTIYLVKLFYFWFRVDCDNKPSQGCTNTIMEIQYIDDGMHSGELHLHPVYDPQMPILLGKL